MEQIFKPANKEEIKQRHEKRIAMWVAEFVKRKDVTKNEDGSYDVNCDIVLGSMNLTKIPIKFRKVTGHFSCFNNQLISLENAPEYVGKWFDCSHNKLTTLEGSPKHVEGYFDCSTNKLTTFEGCPKYVGYSFNCWNNPNVKSLKGIGKVKGRIYSSIKLKK